MPEKKQSSEKNQDRFSIPLYESGKSSGSIPLYEIADELAVSPKDKNQKETSVYYG